MEGSLVFTDGGYTTDPYISATGDGDVVVTLGNSSS